MKLKKPAVPVNPPLEPPSREKRIRRRIVYVILVCVVFAALFMTYKTAIQITPGLYEIESIQDSNVPRYQLGVTLKHYFSGTSLQIRFSIKTLKDRYSDALKDAYRLLDATTVYKDRVNLASINQNQDQELQVPKELYELLQQADSLTRQGRGYSLYAGALYAEWEDLRYLVEPEQADPTRDPDEAARLERLRAATADLSNFSLDFLDDDACKLRFHVEPSYLKLLEELELSDAPILSLNVLEDAYKLQLVAKRLEEDQFHCGVLYTDDGLALALSDFDQPATYTLYGLTEKGTQAAAICSVSAGSAGVSLRNFSLEGEEGYYSVEEDGRTLWRSPWLPADGQYRNVLRAGLICSKSKSLAETVCYAMELSSADSPVELKNLAEAQKDFESALLLEESPQTVYSDAGELQVNEQAGFELAPFSKLK
ncbi:MAG: FAD:protein FMN transferase [Oscillospiraceae bacterium]|nr:FAD:protein FMN transferase [Oscillospiraceae bacterium]